MGDCLESRGKNVPKPSQNFLIQIEFSATTLDRLVTYVGGVLVEFTVEDLNSILRIDDVGLELYTSRKELQFNSFSHVDAVRNICRRRDISDDICSLYNTLGKPHIGKE